MDWFKFGKIEFVRGRTQVFEIGQLGDLFGASFSA